MTLFPEVQARAQAEIDTLLSSADTLRLPTFEDRVHLRYISAIVLEVWRWNPSVPLGECAALEICSVMQSLSSASQVFLMP